MPLMRCKKSGKSGWRWGKSGACFIGPNAKKKAVAQGLAIGEGKLPADDLHKDRHEGTITNFKEFLKQNIIQKRKFKVKRSSEWVYPIGIERQYSKFIKTIMKQFTNITVSEMKPLLKNWQQQNKKQLEDFRQDDAIDDLESINDEYRELQELIFVENIENLRVELGLTALAVGEFNKKQWHKVMKQSLGIVYDTFEVWEDPLVKQWVFENVNLIKGLTDDYIKQINQAVMTGFSQGQTAEGLAKELTKINKHFATGRRDILLNKKGEPILTKTGKPKFRRVQSRSDLIARDQIGKINGQYTRKRQTDVGVDKYIWVDAGDVRVRTTHAVMSGKMCMWDDPSVYSEDKGKTWLKRSSIGGVQLHPGQDYQCRCSAEAVWDDVVTESSKGITGTEVLLVGGALIAGGEEAA